MFNEVNPATSGESSTVVSSSSPSRRATGASDSAGS